jgi:hypothetical protein
MTPKKMKMITHRTLQQQKRRSMVLLIVKVVRIMTTARRAKAVTPKNTILGMLKSLHQKIAKVQTLTRSILTATMQIGRTQITLMACMATKREMKIMVIQSHTIMKITTVTRMTQMKVSRAALTGEVLHQGLRGMGSRRSKQRTLVQTQVGKDVAEASQLGRSIKETTRTKR